MTLLASVMLLASACTGKQAREKTASGLEPANFRTEVDGKQTDLFVLKNKNGMEVCITNFGGRIVSVMVPDKDGVMRDVVLGFDKLASIPFRTTSSSLRISALPSDVMPTVSTRVRLQWMG